MCAGRFPKQYNEAISKAWQYSKTCTLNSFETAQSERSPQINYSFTCVFRTYTCTKQMSLALVSTEIGVKYCIKTYL